MVSLGKGPSDEAVSRHRGTERGCDKASQPWVLAATILGSSMAFIDGAVISIAMPVMQKSFSASAIQMEWVNNAYLLFLSAFVLLGGSLGDRIGRKKIFLIGIVIFTIASIGCGMAGSITLLIVARAVQGLGAALLVPSSLAILGATFDEKDRGKAIGTWAGASAIVASFAPLLGGWLVDSVSWRAIFWLNVPVAALAIILTVRHMPETRDPDEPGRLDYLGAALAALGLAAITYGLSSDPYHVASLVVGGGLLAVFILHEARACNPMVPLSLFRNRNFLGTNLLTLLLYFALSGTLFFIPFYLIQVKGFTATAAGASFLPFTFFMGGLSRWSGGLVGRYGARLPLIVGPLVTTLGLILCSFIAPDRSYWTTLFPGVLTIGLGMTISVAPLTTAVMSSVPPSKVGVASGVNNAVARTAGLLAVAVLGYIVLRVFSGHLQTWLDSHDGTAAAAIRPQIGRLGAIVLPTDLPSIELRSAQEAIRNAFTAGLRLALFVSAGLTVLASLCSAGLIRDKAKPA